MATRYVDGGEKLGRALGDIARKLRRGGELRVGFLAGATYPDGKPVAMIAAIQNWGAPAAGIPARPFFSNMVAKESPGWPEEIRSQLRATGYDSKTTMLRMGAHIKGQLQQSIRDFYGVPLKPATIKRKGFDKQLIESSHILNSADFEYEER